MFLGELVSTYLLLFLGLGSGFIMKENSTPAKVGISWGGAVIIGSIAGVKLGSFNMNPVFSLVEGLNQQSTVWQVLSQIAGQSAGATMAVVVLLRLFGHSKNELQLKQFAAIASSSARVKNFFIELLGTFIMLGAAAVFDDISITGYLKIAFMGSVIAFLITAIGPITGASFNPVRDLFPRYIFFVYQKKKGISINATNSIISASVAPLLAAVFFSFFLRFF